MTCLAPNNKKSGIRPEVLCATRETTPSSGIVVQRKRISSSCVGHYWHKTSKETLVESITDWDIASIPEGKSHSAIIKLIVISCFLTFFLFYADPSNKQSLSSRSLRLSHDR